MPNQYGISRAEQIVDVRPWSARAAEALAQPGNLALALGVCAALMLAVPILLLPLLVLSIVIIVSSRKDLGWLPFRYPPTATDSKGKKGDGILYLGNMEYDQDKERRLPLESLADRFREAWLSDDDWRKHALVLGSTGSGKSELLKGIFFCALCWGSGFFVADGKADNKLPLDVFALARFFGRDDDLLSLNFLLAGKTPRQVRTSRKRRTNKTNPFSTADADTIVQMGANLLPKVEGDSKNWQEKALNCWRGLVPAMCYLRDQEGMEVSVTTFQEYLSLQKQEELYARGYSLAQQAGGVWPEDLLGVKAYLEVGLPGFRVDRCLRKYGLLGGDSGGPRPPGGRPEPVEQEGGIYEQHGYRATQLNPALSLLDKTYGHIFADKFSEVDLVDVTLNNRILVMLIPSLERSSQEAESLGKLTVACLRVMMGRNLGADIEGRRQDILESKATEARYPFIVALDELGYYFADGIAVMFAQARSLGFSMIAAAQDIEKLTEGSRAAEAGAMLANQVCKIFMRIDDANKTNEMIQKYLGKVNVAIKETYQYEGMTGFRRLPEVKIAEVPVATLTNLQSLRPGQAIINSMGQTFKVRSFYVGDFLQKYPCQHFHINRFLQVRPTARTEVTEGVQIGDDRQLISLPIDVANDKQVRGQKMRDYMTGHAQLPDVRELADAATYSEAHDRALGLVDVLAQAVADLPAGLTGAKRGAVLYAAARRYVLSTRLGHQGQPGGASASGGPAEQSRPASDLTPDGGSEVDSITVRSALPQGDLIEQGSGSGAGGSSVADVHDDPLGFLNADKPLERKPAAEVLRVSPVDAFGGRAPVTRAGLESVVQSAGMDPPGPAEQTGGQVGGQGSSQLDDLEPQLRRLLQQSISAGIGLQGGRGNAGLAGQRLGAPPVDSQWIGRALATAAAGLGTKGETVVGFTEQTKQGLVNLERALGNPRAGESAEAIEQLVADQTTPPVLPTPATDAVDDIDALLEEAERSLN